MKSKTRYVWLIVILGIVILITIVLNINTSVSYQNTNLSHGEFNYSQALKEISWDIQGLKDKYDQMRDFSTNKDTDLLHLKITYGYSTHDSPKIGGWSVGTPVPNDDGVWLYFDLHEPDSKTEIDNQPITTEPMCLESKHIQFILLEGSKTTSLQVPIWNILRRHGVKECSS